MRRLPIYFLIDVSESMVGDPINQVQDGIAAIVKELRTDPYALETVYLSIVAFAGKAMKMTSMVELYNFYPPKLPIGGGTSLGKALDFLMDDINTTVKKTTLEEKGDWKPIVFLFTDGTPTDNYEKAFDRWNQKFRPSVNLIAVSIGDNLDAGILQKITENVLLLKDTDEESFSKFFKWVTASIKASSISISANNVDELYLAPVTNGFLSKVNLEKKQEQTKTDDNYAVFIAKCQDTKRPYLIKYQKQLADAPFKEFMSLKVLKYRLKGAYPVDNNYFELADNSTEQNTINTNALEGFPTCPCCGNQYGFSSCVCGKLLCTGEQETSTCPWCGVVSRYTTGGSANISRTKG